MDDNKNLARQIRDSGLFDGEWYLKEYPDVARLGIDPAEHYARWGWRLGRKPARDWDARSFGERPIEGMLSGQTLSEALRHGRGPINQWIEIADAQGVPIARVPFRDAAVGFARPSVKSVARI